ncbi:MAG: Ig-like domain-containing protein [Candidatus Thorarchaeota archaeon]
MKKAHALAVIVICTLTLQVFALSSSQGVLDTPQNSIENTLPVESVELSGAGGEDPLITNIIANNGFEEFYANGQPIDWNIWGTSSLIVNGSYQDLVNTGTYSGLLETQGTSQWSGNAQFYKNYGSQPYPYLSQDMTMEMYYYLVSVPDTSTSSSYIRLYVSFYNGSLFHTINYYLSHQNTYNPSNDSNYGYFLLNSTVGSWHHLDRNLTSDYEECFGAIPVNMRVYETQWYVSSDTHETTPSTFVIDDVSLRNSTSYEFISNNDFESGDGSGWGHSRSSPARFASSQDCVEGTKSVNITVQSTAESSYCGASLSVWDSYPDGWFVQGPGTLAIEFDWKYNDVANGGDQQTSYFYVYLDNSTTWHEIRWYLGRDLDQNSLTNSTYYTYMNATGFGSRDSWQHFSVDLYDVFQERNLSNITVDGLSFSTQVGSSANSSVILLLDDFQLHTYPTSDPGFEQDWYYETYQPLTGWRDSGSTAPYLDRTDDSHSGDWAANMTLDGNRNSAIYNSFFLPVYNDLYTDFWWRLDYVNNNAGSCINYIQLGFDGGYDLNYVLGSGNYAVGNTTYNGYILIDEFNSTGSWNNLIRNVLSDTVAVFGNNQWNLTEVRCYSYTSGDNSISTIFDDMHFVQDTHAPVITSVSQVTAAPNYYEPTLIRAEATDMEVTGITLHYNNGSWHSTQMIDMGTYYDGWIPSAPFDTYIQFYVVASDSIGLTSTDDNGGANYVYTIGDDVSPTISVISPYESSTVSNSVSFELDLADPDSGSSGLSYVEVWDGSTLLFAVSTSLSSFEWDSRTVSNGTHNLGFKVFDIAGNTAMDNLTLDVQNDVGAPILSTVALNPSSPVYYEDVLISIAAVDATNVESVTLNYRVDSGGWNSVLMDTSGALYSGVIPAEDWNTEVEYYIVAFDAYGMSSSYGSELDPMSYVVDDDIVPVLSVSGPLSESTLQGIANFTVTGSDSGSSIVGIELLINSVSEFTSTSVPADFHWDTSVVENGEYALTFIVQDGAGNIATIELNYTVNNPVGLNAVVPAFENFMSQYGFFVGVATIIGLFVIFKLMQRRRGAS